MTLINQVLAEDVSISTLKSTAPKISNDWKITDIFTKGGFDLINLIFIFVGLFFFANLVMAGWDFMMSSGDAKKIQSASTRLINGLLGLIMAVAAFVIIRLISNVIGVGNLI